MYNHLFFDLDNTVTRSRSPISDQMRELLISIPDDIVIVSGASEEQIKTQIDGVSCICMGQNGNTVIDTNGKELWRHTFSKTQKKGVYEHIALLEKLRTWDVRDTMDLIEDRGSQISYSSLGHHEDLSLKQAFDPDHKKRIAMLTKCPLHAETIEAKVAGTTTIDYFEKGKHKGYNIAKLITTLGWKKEECLYFGDCLFPGGNDETVIGVIDTKSVGHPQDTFEILRNMYDKN